MSLNLTEVTADLGAYFRDRKNEILTKLYAAEDMRKYFTSISGVQDEYVITEMMITELTQAYQKGFTPKGEAAFRPEINKVRPIKVDFTFEPKALEGQWIGYLKSNGSSPTEYPFCQFIYDKMIEKVGRELSNTTINGIYVAPTVGTAGAAINAFDGLIKKVVDGITASKIDVISTGALTTSNIRDKVEVMVDGLPTEHKNQDLVLLMSPDWAKAYFRKNRADFGGNTDYVSGKTTVDFTNVTIVTPLYMSGSNRMIITPKSNLLLLEDGVNEEVGMLIQQNRREIEIMMDFKRGVGFGIMEDYVWANDVV